LLYQRSRTTLPQGHIVLQTISELTRSLANDVGEWKEGSSRLAIIMSVLMDLELELLQYERDPERAREAARRAIRRLRVLFRQFEGELVLIARNECYSTILFNQT
jgi:hypothetical protein